MITGAGILLLENYKGYPVIVLFGKHNKYSDLGGYIDPGESPEQCACRESREESCNLLYITPQQLSIYATPIKCKQYVSFVLYIKNIKKTHYEYNSKQISNYCKSNKWKETNQMTRIPLNNCMNNISSSMIDVYGRRINIRDRTQFILKSAMNIIVNTINKRPCDMVHKKTTTSRMKCLIGTHTYYINNNLPKLVQNNFVFGNIKTGLYLTPDITSHPNLLLQNKWGGLHVTILGFSDKNNNILSIMSQIANNGKKLWKINSNTITVKNDTLYFKSKTLDNIANILKLNGYSRIKGPVHSNCYWHITLNNVPNQHIINSITKTKWYLTRVTMTNNNVNWHEHILLHM